LSTTVTNQSQAAAPPRTTGWFAVQHKVAPYLFVSPFLILFAVFGIYPIIKSVLLSFYDTVGPKVQVYTGMTNFQYMFHDHDFWTAVKNTSVYALCSIFIQIPMALGLAVLLNQKWLRGTYFWRLAFYSPNLIGLVFAALLFQQLFAAQYGLVNRFLHAIDHNFSIGTNWLGDPHNVMPALVLVALWLYVGYNMIYLVAGMQAVDKELYEAAMVDGANGFQQFVHITVPGIKPVLVFVLVTATIGSFQLFDLPYIMLSNSPGPNDAGLSIVMYLYNNGFIIGNLGYASAVGWVLALGILTISLVQVWLTGTAKGTES
jgi:ABC-type sugar transport system permease subunit